MLSFFQCSFKIDVLEHEFNQEAITAEVIGPSGPIYADFEMTSSGGQGKFLTDEMGMHEVLVMNEGEAVRGSPHFLRTMPKSKKDYDGIEPCAVGSTVEVLINPHHAAKPELLEVRRIRAGKEDADCADYNLNLYLGHGLLTNEPPSGMPGKRRKRHFLRLLPAGRGRRVEDPRHLRRRGH
jgi:hypothetical protein